MDGNGEINWPKTINEESYMKKFLYVLVSLVFPGVIMTQPNTGAKNPHVYFVILAGGSGERLWPLSRQNKPKQLLSVGSEQTLLEQAINRVEPLASRENILVCTTEQHAHSISNLVGSRIGNIIVEPGARNTGPAILLSCLELQQKDPHAVVVFMPADPFIPAKDNNKYVQFLEHALDFVSQEDKIILLGVKPTYAATGYGYIECVDAKLPTRVKKFHEKPTLEKAQEYEQSNAMLWNIGMFGGKVSVFINEYRQLAPQMYAGVIKARAGVAPYDDVESNSIDYAIMEKSNNVYVLPVDFAWCDVGNIEVFLSIKEQLGYLKNHKIVAIESRNNLVDVPGKMVALIGVSDLCIVETDQVLLITRREDAEKVRAVVKQLKQGEFKEYL